MFERYVRAMADPATLPFAQARQLLMKDREAGLQALHAERLRLIELHGELPLDARCEYAGAMVDADRIDELLDEATAIIRIAKMRDDRLHGARGYLSLAVYHWRTNEIRLAASAIDKARELVPAGASRVAASIEEADGLIHKAQGRLDLAAECLMRARDLAAESSLALQRVRISINLVSIFQHLGDYKAALDEGEHAREFLQNSDDLRSQYILAYNLCAAHIHLKHYEAALREALAARDYKQRAGVQFSSAGLDVLFAKVYSLLGRFDEAREAADRVCGLPDQGFEPNKRLKALAEIGQVYHRIGAHEEADACFERAFTGPLNERETPAAFDAQLARLELWLDMGRVPKAHNSLAAIHASEAKDLEVAARLLALRGRVAAAHGDFESAYSFEQARARLLAELSAVRSDRELRNLQVIHRVKEERAVREALEVSNEALTLQVRDQTQALERARRLEALGRLSGGVAHDFSNLLTVMGGCTQLLEGAIPRTSESRALIAEMKGAVQRGASLAERLLAFGQRMDLTLKRRTAFGLLDNMRFLLVRLVGERVVLDFHDEIAEGEQDLQVLIDEPQLDAVLLNLALNARDAMPDGGRLSLAMRIEHNELIVDVEDTGTGVSESVASSLFEPFATTKEVVGGMGLGLSSSLGVMRGMGGSLELVSTSKNGSLFRLRLPLCEPEEIVELAPHAKVDLRERRALVIEDDSAVRNIIASFLRHLGMQVSEAVDGTEALELMQASKVDASETPLPDVLVCDVSMPRCTGPELVNRMRAKGLMIPVLFVSGWHGRHLNLDHTSDPTLDFMEKPIEIGELGRRLRALLDTQVPKARSSSPEVSPNTTR